MKANRNIRICQIHDLRSWPVNQEATTPGENAAERRPPGGRRLFVILVRADGVEAQLYNICIVSCWWWRQVARHYLTLFVHLSVVSSAVSVNESATRRRLPGRLWSVDKLINHVLFAPGVMENILGVCLQAVHGVRLLPHGRSLLSVGP